MDPKTDYSGTFRNKQMFEKKKCIFIIPSILRLHDVVKNGHFNIAISAIYAVI